MKWAVGCVFSLAAAWCGAQSPACLSDPVRHAQLADQDAAQLYELQARYGTHEVSQRTQDIFERLIDSLHTSNQAAYMFDWRLVGYGALAINAHAMHTGKIVVTQGLDSAEVPPEMVAASLAHEIAHVLLRHGLQQACFALQVVNPSLTLRQAEADLMQEMWASSPELGKRVRSLNHANELEADAKGVELLVHAGYPVDSMSRMLKMLAAKQPTTGWSTGSHPDHQLRIAKALEVEAQYAQAPARSFGTVGSPRPAR